ncbi:uncharacterized protein EKO05_0001054 [Ascochyta rabiei]|uniref:Uncharacterized protein n=1 Tax=Didymella rabiei TaxID=5454 RepID=A0A163EQJ5_DIDRA|nr:uncharacterized protein EKO05_0001054 [Ascochyta rabiei]KZM23847.1 hypothetical protein ST47_g5011 [Ascochyta rabiei]UPX10392.1 hypothetical protein EKO05_0001054 [Ascochyta rabiei]
MAFAQQHRPPTSRQLSFHAPEPAAAVATSSQQLKRRLEESEEWVLFSPTAPSTIARTHTTSTERTPRTAGLSRFSECGSLDTAARSDHDDDNGTFLGTEEELDSLDDGLHAFHEPSEHALPASRLQQSGDTVLPNHDGLGSFHPDATMQEHMWQFERSPRRRAARRRSSVQRHLTVLDDTDQVTQEQERRQRIEKWRLEQSKAVLEEIERETRRRRRMSMATSARSQRDTARQDTASSTSSAACTVTSEQSEQSEGSDEGTENMSFWQRLTTRVIRDLIGLDQDTLSVIFGETLPEEAMTPQAASPMLSPANQALRDAVADASADPGEDWQTRVLERVAQELGVLVHQLSEHPGAFSTYQRAQAAPEYAGLAPAVATDLASSLPTSSQSSAHSPASVQFAATFPPQQTSHTYSEASLWGIEEEPDEVDAVDTSQPDPAAAARAVTEDAIREREYWERDLDVKMIFSVLVKRFTSRRSSTPTPTRRASASTHTTDDGAASARRAAMIRQNHPLVSRTTDRGLPTSSSPQPREAKRRDSSTTYRTHFNAQSSLRQKTLRSSSSCASQSTKKSKRSGSSQRNYWDLGGSVGSGSVLAGEI